MLSKRFKRWICDKTDHKMRYGKMGRAQCTRCGAKPLKLSIRRKKK